MFALSGDCHSQPFNHFEHCKHTITINYNPNFISFFNKHLTFGSVLLGLRDIVFKTLY